MTTNIIEFGRIYKEDLAQGASPETVILADGQPLLMHPLLDANGNVAADAYLKPFTSIKDYGGSPTATATVNTAALNAAIAAAILSGDNVYIPAGRWSLNAVDAITDSVEILGAGRKTILVFDTTGDGFYIHPASGDQNDTYRIHDLAFDNETNTPSTFIRNNLAVNVKLERLYFSACTVTYAVDNESGYGMTIKDCVFSDITGNALRFRQDAGLTKYSYAFCVSDNDFTRISGTGIEIEGTLSGQIRGGVIEACGKGIYLNPQGATVQAWNLNLTGTHFESNTVDIDCNTSASYWATINAMGITLAGTPTINLDDKGQLILVGCQQGGGDVCTISGSSEARVTLVGGNTANFTQSGTFRWLDLGQFYDGAGTPSWDAITANPALGDGVLTSRLSQLGDRVTYELLLQVGSTSTTGTGNWVFGDALLTVIPAANFHEACGTAILQDASGAYEVGAVFFADEDQLYIATASGLVSPTVPWTWAEDDEIRLSITYRC